MPDSPLPNEVTPRTVPKYIRDSRKAKPEPLGRLLDYYKPYLRAIARREFDPALVGKLSPSDVVQETFIDAHRDFESFTSETHAELKRWLRALLLNNLIDCRRLFVETEMRDVGRELPIHWLTLRDQSEISDRGQPLSPLSQLIQVERASALQAALSRLSQESRQLIYLRHQLRYTFPKIAERLAITPGAARMRYVRCLEELRLSLEDPAP